MIAAVVYINKVSHLTMVEYSVPEIATNTGSKQCQSNVNQSVLTCAEKENHSDYYKCANRDCC